MAVKAFYKTEDVHFIYLDLKNKKDIEIEYTKQEDNECKEKLISTAKKIYSLEHTAKKNKCSCEYSIICYYSLCVIITYMKDYLIDTHAHIDMITEEGVSVSQILDEMYSCKVNKAIIPAVEIETQEKILRIVNSQDDIYGMVGLFPSEAKKYTKEIEESFEHIAAENNKIVAVGEIGLDYYWDKTFVDIQQEVFKKQILLANRLNLPVVVHDREAHKDTFDILKDYNKNSDVLFHCFSGSVEFMREVVKQGWYVAIGGVVTFKNAVKMKEVAKEVPMDRLVLETDSPYLTPVPYRGKQNRPAYVKYVAEEIAKIRGVSVEEIINATTQNAERFFRI